MYNLIRIIQDQAKSIRDLGHRLTQTRRALKNVTEERNALREELKNVRA